MSIQEQVEHEMEDWTGPFEMDVDPLPTMEYTTELLKELGMGMWDSVEEMTHWNPTSNLPGLDLLEKPDATRLPSRGLNSPKQYISPMDLDAPDTPGRGNGITHSLRGLKHGCRLGMDNASVSLHT